MYIKSFFIDGFGIFSGQSVSNLKNGLNIFCGYNEAGKSTCLEFLRTMLFGFQRQYSNYYPPLRGGGHGGRLVLESSSAGTLHIERRPGKSGLVLTDENGISVSAETLSRLMPGVTRQLYGVVYGFGLDALQELETLNKSEIQNALYGASFGLGARTVSQALAELEKEMQDIFRPNGSTQPMALHLKEFESLSLDLKQKRTDIEQYNELLNRQGELHRQSEVLREELDLLESRRRTLRRHLELRDIWKDYLERTHRLSLIPDSGAPFTSDSLERLERLCAEKETHSLDFDRVMDRLERIQEELRQTCPRREFLESESRIQELIEGKAAYLKLLTEEPQCAAELQQTRNALSETSANLGAEFTAQWLKDFDISVSVYDRLERFEQSLRAAENALRTAQDRAGLLEGALSEAVREEEQAASALRAASSGHAALWDTAQDLLRDRGAIEHCARSIPDLRATVEHGRKELTRLFYELGEGWTTERLECFDTSTAFCSRIGELGRELSNARRLYDDALLAHEHAEYNCSRLKERLVVLEAAAKGTGMGWRILLPALSACGLCAGLILLVLGVADGHGISVFLENRLAALVSGGAFFLAGLVGFGTWAFVRTARNNSREAQAQENLEAACRELDLARARLEERAAGLKAAEDGWRLGIGNMCPEVGFSIETAQELVRKVVHIKSLNRELVPQAVRLKQLEETLEQHAQCLNCESEPESVLSELDRLEQVCRTRRDSLDCLQRARERLESARLALSTAEEECRGALQKRDELVHKWQEWLVGLGLSEELLPSSVRRVFAEVLRAKELMAKEGRLERHLEELRMAVRNFEHALDAVPGSAEFGGESPARRIDLLARALRDAKDAAVRQQEKLRTLEETLRMKEECSRRIEATKNAISALLASVGAQDIERFRVAYETWKHRQELAVQCEELRARLETGAGDGGLEALQVTLNRFEENLDSAPETEMLDLERRCAELSQNYQKSLEEKGGVSANLKDLERSGDETELCRKRAALRAEIETLAWRWSVLALAQHFLHKAKAKYEIERQPAVMREAGALFSCMTGGKYRGLVPMDAGGHLAVLAASGDVLPWQNLSRGTREQLFLAMRMAYIQDHGRHAEPLPVIMDDILVNFDPERAHRTAESVAVLARTQQVIFFTCHPRTADTLGAFEHKRFEVKNGVILAK